MDLMRAIEAARDLNSDAPVNHEYVRGQVELICNLLTNDPEWWRPTITAAILPDGIDVEV